ncbi:hypothetical protein [uncultured Cohaesibacter sp.]|uniref:hypothetical protein n=1 Tax=uncultured Cohaesibacter sp. TaxID=1002546 RepID=UPI002931B75A|nr:hypothetical protein [uncultured Cohaesibacter sp.]
MLANAAYNPLTLLPVDCLSEAGKDLIKNAPSLLVDPIPDCLSGLRLLWEQVPISTRPFVHIPACQV